MKTESKCRHAIVLRGIDGSNPLAFLAALGTLRSLTIAWPERSVRMAWVQNSGAWRPELTTDADCTPTTCVATLHKFLRRMVDSPTLAFADNLNVTASEFRTFALQCTTENDDLHGPTARIAADFAAAFACDALVTNDGKIQDTALRTMSGAGHQHFIAFMRNIVKLTTEEHLHKALFDPWRYTDPVANQTLRWDPTDDSRYALQWRDPSGDPSRRQAGGMLGANRLAIEGLPLLTCAPVGGSLRTTSFTGRGARDTFWTWPIWSGPIPLDTCRSLLASSLLRNHDASSVTAFKTMGVVSVFRSQRITTGKFRNFTPATTVF